MSEKYQEEIKKMKKELVKVAMEHGIWENFGQKEIRVLKDKYDYCTRQYKDTELSKAIRDFDEWCMNYNGETIYLMRSD